MGRHGLSLLLTRAEDDNQRWAAQLRDRGHTPICLPCLSCEPVHTPELRAALTAALPLASAVAFTSRRGVEASAALLGGTLGDVLIAAVGPATADAARARFGRVDILGPQGEATSLASAIATRVPGGAVLLLAADQARPELEACLRAAGLQTQRYVVYHTRPTQQGEVPIPPLAAVDAILLASPSAVQGLMNLLGGAPAAPAVALGPTTAAAARAAGIMVAGEARSRGLDALLDALPDPLNPREPAPTEIRS